MSKVLLILPAAAPHPAVRLLRLLGIPHDVAYFTGDLQTPAGNFAWNNDAAIRNYFRQNYRAVLVGIYTTVYRLSQTETVMRAYRWLGWNDPEDPPIAYLGVYPRAGYTDMGTLPSDFPIIPPDPANPSGTTASYNATNFDFTANLRVQLHRENTEIYISAANLYQDGNGTARIYLLDIPKHAALGNQGEILATPVSEDIAFPPNAVLAYRYKNRYLLPMAYRRGGEVPVHAYHLHGMFWVLYALKLMQIVPVYSLPLFLAMDDALLLHQPPPGSETIQPTFAQFARIGYETYRYIAEVLHPRCGMVMVCTLETGGRYGRLSLGVPYGHTHWASVVEGRIWTGSGWQPLDAETRTYLTLWHQTLVRHHRGALPCTPHDHTLTHHANRTFINFRRHNDAGFAYAAPSDVPITRGSTLVKASAYTGTVPAGARERWIDGERYYEWGFTATSGSGEVISSITPNNYYAARLVFETAAAEMLALGFPDAVGGDDYPLLIAPFGDTGDVSLWKAFYELGYRLVRAHQRTPKVPPDSNPASFLLPREGLWFADNYGVDMSTQFDTTFGLYHPSYVSRTATGAWNLDIAGDISGLWDTERPTAAQRAYRRAIGLATNRLINIGLGVGVMMAHPFLLLPWADPNDPTRPFDPNDPRVSINFLLEMAWNMEKVVNVLHPYLKWGTVKEYIAMRERMLT